MGELILMTAVFIVCSGVVACVDAAVLSVTRGEIEELALRNAWGSWALKQVTRHMTRVVVVVVIVTNTINVVGPIVIGHTASLLFGSSVLGIVTGVLAFLTIIFSEIIPKSLGAHYAPFIARWSAPIILGLIFALFPIVWILEKFVRLFKEGKRVIGTEDQIRALARIGHRAGYIRESEGQIIQRAFILNDKTVADIMVPKDKVVCVRANLTIREAADVVFRYSYSRYPIVGETMDDVQGLALSRDILGALAEAKDQQSVTSIKKNVLLVSARMRADKLLLHFRDQRIHLALVRDGETTVGLVTLEDVLEELVGEIEDEGD